MFSKELEEIIDAAIADGVLSDVERRVLHKRAAAEGIDPDELDVVVEGRLAKLNRKQAFNKAPAPPPMAGIANMKMGNVLTCPSCGAQVKAGSAVCAECGYAFTNIQASNAARELQRKLDEYNRRQEASAGSFANYFSLNQNMYKPKVDLLATFPVPNSRLDLLDLLSMSEVQMDASAPHNGMTSDRTENLGYGFWLLYNNCINKARISFNDDPDFAHYFARYEQEVKKTKGFMGWWRSVPRSAKAMIWMVIIYAILGGGVWGFISHMSNKSKSRRATTEYTYTAPDNMTTDNAVSDEETDGDSDGTTADGDSDGTTADSDESDLPKGSESMKERLKAKYDYVYSESDGLYKVEKGNKKGYCDAATGKEVVPCKYDYIYSWDDDGMAKVEIDNKKGYINKQGKEVVPCEYDYIYSWDGGLAKVEKGDKKGYINKQGKLVSPLE
ncbi:MAG: WG repeat-containing protein [Muribaculaceae bacterium]|nr:WG repeat-containing protein [Muribaculaceae bacterium]